MIDSSLGATFAPTQDPTTKPPASPVESAVQLISAQLPRVFGAPTPVNPALLAGVGGVHPAVASAVVRSVLQALFGPSGLPGGLAPSGSGEAGDLSRATFQFGGGSSTGTPPNPSITFGTTPGGTAPVPPPVGLKPLPVGSIPSPSGPSAPMASNPIAPPPVPAAAGSFGAPLQGGRDTLGKF